MGFCCENCYLYDEHKTCLKSKSRSEEVDKPDTNVMEGLTLRSAAIEGELLKVIISQKEGKEKTIYFDLKQYLIS